MPKKNIIIYFLSTLSVLISIHFLCVSICFAEITKNNLKKIESQFLKNKEDVTLQNNYKKYLIKYLINSYHNNKIDISLEICNKALFYFPEDKGIKKIVVGIYFKKAKKLFKEQDLDNALKYLKNCQKISETPSDFTNSIINVLKRKYSQYYKKHDYEAAKKTLKKILNKDKDNQYALYHIGQILVEENKLQEALGYWQKIPSNNSLNVNMNFKISQLRKDINFQKDYKKISRGNFNFYTPKDYQEISYSLREVINQAYREIGTDFNYYPKRQISIIFYPKKNYNKFGDHMYITAGFYDKKIRLPLEESNYNFSKLSRILRHEYTHLVVTDLTMDKIPIWLNEGLAEYEAGVNSKRKKYLKKQIQNRNIYPFATLNNILSESTNQNKLSTAYTECFAIVDYIVERFNFFKINQILDNLRKGRSINEILEKKLGRNEEKLLREVKQFIQEKY